MTDNGVNMYYFVISADTTPACRKYETDKGAKFHIMINAYSQEEGKTLALERVLDHAYTNPEILHQESVILPLPPGADPLHKKISGESMTSGMGVAILGVHREGFDSSENEPVESQLFPVVDTDKKH